MICQQRSSSLTSRVWNGVRKFAAPAAVVMFITGTLCACQIPVFRYALERWNADAYKVIVLHDKPLTQTQTSALAALKSVAESRPNQPAAIEVEVINVSDNKQANAHLQATWKSQPGASEPVMLIHYPPANRVGRNDFMFQAKLNQQNVASVSDSPVRREVAKRLSAGDSAVWIFVPCGQTSEDEAALRRLEEQLAADVKRLELPSPKDLEVKPEVLEQIKVPLKIQFSTVKLNRDDPAEQFLLKSLLNSEDDLVDFDQPLAFPVFGRGRVLYALVGNGIASDTVRMASSFIAGPCSCQVKNQNLGFDLLLQTDWKKALGDVLISAPIGTENTESNAPILLKIPPGNKSRK